MRKARVFAIGLALLPVTLAALRWPLATNWSESEPVGLYLKTYNRADPYIRVCLDSAAEQRAIEEGIERPKGECPTAHMPLVKQLYAASPEHPVSFSTAGFTVAGALLPNTSPVDRSSKGLPLQHMPFGLYTSGLFAISTHNAGSFDSRYFGPIQKGEIIGYAKPLLTW